MLNQSTIIILRKQPYQEHNLIIEGVTPDFGKMSLMLYGGQKMGGKKFIGADIFQEFDFSFEENTKSDMQIAKDFELLTDCSNIASNALNFKFAGKLGKFLLQNSSYNLPMPLGYDSARNCFVNLAYEENQNHWTLEECAVAFKLAYVYENGYLPEITDIQQNNLLENLISSAVEGIALNINPTYCHQLNLWLNSLLDYHKIAR